MGGIGAPFCLETPLGGIRRDGTMQPPLTCISPVPPGLATDRGWLVVRGEGR